VDDHHQQQMEIRTENINQMQFFLNEHPMDDVSLNDHEDKMKITGVAVTNRFFKNILHFFRVCKYIV
jgi:hypothetical protein